MNASRFNQNMKRKTVGALLEQFKFIRDKGRCDAFVVETR